MSQFRMYSELDGASKYISVWLEISAVAFGHETSTNANKVQAIGLFCRQPG